jgi:virulence-associated protein VagC
MSSSPKTRSLAAVVALGAALGGCSDIYWDRRETVSLGANDAVETNKVVHMVDPWPRSSTNRDIAFNGERMEIAQERYRQNRVIRPVNVTTSSAAYQKAQEDAAAAAARIPAASAAAPVKGP